MNEESEKKEKVLMPVFEKVKKLKLFQDFDVENNDFRFGFILPTKDEEGNIIGNDVWCVTPKGLKNRRELEYSGEVILSDLGEQIDIKMLECFRTIPEIKEEEVNLLVKELNEREELLRPFRKFSNCTVDSRDSSDSRFFYNTLIIKGLYVWKCLISKIMSTISTISTLLSELEMSTISTNLPTSNTVDNNIKKSTIPTISTISSIKELILSLEQWETDLNLFFSRDSRLSIDSRDFKNPQDIYYLYYINPSEIAYTLFKVIKDIINYYVDYRDEQEGASTFYALYLMTTYLYRLFPHLGYILFVGQKRSGKTKNLTLAQCMAWNPVSSGNMSPPSLFRIIDAVQPTLVLDETDLIAKYKTDLYQLLLSGATKDFPVFRTEEKGRMKKLLIPKTFDVFSPKIMAGISGFDEILEDRCLKIIMVRSRGEKAYREIDKNNPFYKSFLRPLLLAWAISFNQLVDYIYKNLEVKSEILNPREIQYFKPVLTVAYLCGEEVYNQALHYLEFKSMERLEEEETESLDVIVLKLLVYKWEEKKKDYSISARELSELVNSIYDLEATPRKIASVLKKLKLSEKYPSMGRVRFVIRKKNLEELVDDYFLKWDAIIEEFKEKEEEVPEIETLTSQKDIILKTIRQACSMFGGIVPVQDVEKMIMEKLGMEKEKVDNIIEKLKQEGAIFEPKQGMISVIGWSAGE